jgi:hypothetical protein
MDAEWFAHDIASRHARIEGRERILEDDLHRASMGAKFGLPEMGEVQAIKPDAAAGRFDQAQDAPRDRRFSAAGLADESECFPNTNRKTDAIYRVHGADGAAKDAASDGIVFDEVRYLEQRACVGHGDLAVSAARQHAAR